jgi:hypothetical protein
MKNIKSFPDLANSARLIKISVELEDVPDTSVMGMAIQIGLREDRLRDVIKMIQSQAGDNRPLMVEIVGEDLLKAIENVNI